MTIFLKKFNISSPGLYAFELVVLEAQRKINGPISDFDKHVDSLWNAGLYFRGEGTRERYKLRWFRQLATNPYNCVFQVDLTTSSHKYVSQLHPTTASYNYNLQLRLTTKPHNYILQLQLAIISFNYISLIFLTTSSHNNILHVNMNLRTLPL